MYNKETEAELKNKTIDHAVLAEVYARLRHARTRTQIDDTIWEVNDRLDGYITWNEFTTYYERCKSDKTGLEPMDFYYLLCFLMYDKDHTGTLTIDEAMHMMYVGPRSCSSMTDRGLINMK